MREKAANVNPYMPIRYQRIFLKNVFPFGLDSFETMSRTKFIFIWAWWLFLSCSVHAGEFWSELYPCPVSIK